MIELHGRVGGQDPGRRYGLEVLNKSAVVLVTAFWEAYCEDVASEALEHLVNNVESADKLPLELQKRVAKQLEADDHDLAVWRLADQGWRVVLQERLHDLTTERNLRLNTPKTGNIDALFLDAVGIDAVSSSWNVRSMTAKQAAARLDHFVVMRGAIAHRGAALSSVRKKDVVEYYELVKAIASRTGGKINTWVRKSTGTALW